MLRIIPFIVIIVLAFVLMVSSASALGSTLRSAPIPSATCAEDDRCWNWATMGNRHRGVVTMYGRPMIVGPCRFARLMRAGRLDYRASDRMRGDATAMRVCPR